MNTTCLPTYRAAQVGICFALAPLSLVVAFAATAAPASVAPVAPKPHVLFMGADIALEKDKAFHPVEDVTEASVVIKSGTTLINVPLEQSRNLRINESLKITRTSVAINDLIAERAYTLDTDPFIKFAKSASLAFGKSAEADIAHGDMLRAQTAGVGAGNMAAMPSNPAAMADAAATKASSAASEASALGKIQGAYEAPTSDLYDMGSQSGKMGLDAARELFDAIRLTFEVTSEEDLTQPYLAIIALIRDRDSKPGQVRKWAYVKALGQLRAGVAKKVNVYQGGMPLGYVLESCEVHLYNRGEELATNLSRKRVPLTDEEALEYRIIEYVGANKERTLPATPLTKTLRATLTPAQLSMTCYVRVAKDGRALAVFRDADAKQPLQDPVLESALKTLRFKPALNIGKPVESITPITLGRLASP